LPNKDPLQPINLSKHRADELRRVVLLIDEAEAKLERQYKLLNEVRAKGLSTERAEATMHLLEELLADLYTHLAVVQKLRV
jgi:hypothetical protein